MYHYIIDISYDGSNFNGWQRLKNNPNTIQGIIEQILSKCLCENITINGSGRTDAGVHALHQIADFHCRTAISKDNFISFTKNANQLLPDQIRINNISDAPTDFHSRKSAISKTYTYCISLNSKCDVFARKYLYNPTLTPVFYTPPKSCDLIDINVNAMKFAAAHLIGKHDFKSFTTDKTSDKSFVRTINSIDFIVKETTAQKKILIIKYNGNGFLYNMVRILSGTLLLVGLNQLTPADVKSILDSKMRENAGPTLPANALFLCGVEY